MLIRSKRPHALTDNDVTDERLFRQRRDFIRTGTYGAGALALVMSLPLSLRAATARFTDRIAAGPRTRVVDEPLNTWEHITTYNNFYELGTDKSDPAANADALITEPWTVKVDGKCGKPGTYALEDLLTALQFEERVYRFRCVEAWSMVIPWNGFALGDLLNRFEPDGSAKYVAFETLYDKKNPLPGQRRAVLDWPYREGLRMDEAMHALSFMAIGVYGKPLPNQNGAPLRLVVPWKYGFKSIKSIVRISFTENEPRTSWKMANPREYGFYSNVNPEVDHPRWSQARERRIGEYLKRKTLMFNGYADEVAGLYAGMDLKKHY